MAVYVLVIGLFFVAAGAFMLYQGHDPLQAWGTIVFFGACALVGISEIWNSRSKKAPIARPGDRDLDGHTLIIRGNFLHLVVFGLASAAIAFAGYVMVAIEKAPIIGYLTVGFFGLGAVVFFWQVLDRRPRLVIDADGVIDRMLGIGRIAWTDLEWAYLQQVNGVSFVCLVLHDPSAHIDKMSWLQRNAISFNKSVGCTELNLNLAGITVDPEDVLRIVLWHILENNKERSNWKPSEEFRA